MRSQPVETNVAGLILRKKEFRPRNAPPETFPLAAHGTKLSLKWPRWNITTLNCTDYENRAFYTGDYDNNICAITIISTTIEDTGDW